MSWQPTGSQAIAHTLHVAALTGIVGSGYKRRDAILRRGASVPEANISLEPLELTSALEHAARHGESPWGTCDTTWFEKRWSLGEERATRQHSQSLVDALGELRLDALLSRPILVQASAAIGARALSIHEPALVVAAPGSCPMGVAVAALAAQALVHFPITTLSIDELHWQAQFVAASRIRAHLGQLAFSDWLRPLMSHLLGSFERASSIEARVRRIAEATLDQPPGEVERIGVGLGRRLESRLDRALRRSFFTPESPDLAQWIGTQTGHREANQSD